MNNVFTLSRRKHPVEMINIHGWYLTSAFLLSLTSGLNGEEAGEFPRLAGKIFYQPLPTPIEYFKTSELTFFMSLGCEADQFSLIQHSFDGTRVVDWAKEIGKGDWHTNDTFIIHAANFSQCGNYIAKCGNASFDPNPLPVYISVNPLIVAVDVSDKLGKSKVVNTWLTTEGPLYVMDVYLADDDPTSLTFDVGLGSFEQDTEKAEFSLAGANDVTDAGRVVDNLKYENYPDGQRISYELTGQQHEEGAPNKCQVTMNASTWMDSEKKKSIDRAFLNLNFKYPPRSLKFSIYDEVGNNTEHCVLKCSLGSTCPNVIDYSMQVVDDNGKIYYSIKSASNWAIMKLAFFNCEWLATHRHLSVICKATNEVGTTEKRIPLIDVPELDRFVPPVDYVGLGVIEGILIGVGCLLLISIGANAYLIWKLRQDRPSEVQTIEITSKMQSVTSLSTSAPSPSNRHPVRPMLSTTPSVANSYVGKRSNTSRPLPKEPLPPPVTDDSDNERNYVVPSTKDDQPADDYEDEYSDAKSGNFANKPAVRPSFVPLDETEPEYNSLSPQYVDPTNKRFLKS